MKIAARCDQGLLRRTNQDSIYYSEQNVGVLPNLMIIADGMGGHQAGEKASQTAVSSMVNAVLAEEELPDEIEEWLEECAIGANTDVYKLSMSNPLWQGMGTTLVAATCIDDVMYCINVGDSRLYVLEQPEGEAASLRQVTVDHSVVEEMVRNGILSPEEARQHPQKNLITRGVGLEDFVDVDTFTVPLADVRMILLCSDGLTNMIEEKEILKIMLLNDGNPDRMAERLKDEANRNGGYDNISVIVADVRGE